MRILLTLLLLSSSQAFAAGYSCLSVDRDTQVLVHFVEKTADVGAFTAPEAKQVVFIDPTLSKKSQVLAVLESEALKTAPSGEGVIYNGSIDPHVKNPGKYLGGTRLGQLAEISMTVQTVAENSRAHILSDGLMYAAQVSYLKKNGQVLTQDFDCALFLGDHIPELN